MHLERAIRRAGRELADRQVARLFKIPEEMAQTPCDFIGFRKDGVAILLECKQVNRPSLSIVTSPGLQPHQFGALEDCWRAGGIALVAWQRRQELALIPFEALARLSVGRSRRSVAWADLPAELVAPAESYLDSLERAIADAETPNTISRSCENRHVRPS